ncbi:MULTISPECIES: hypothetical protein [Oerskovia]|uniref:Uncharacterized protein n=1 Tax=Oerskovia gallyi TaxID=2762226 RepID=A0ABR8V579_9CELL|nr:hypothetical protein [Oerskovia gallyi]MBD7999929.1 hypothetical protein [Oerskovia gallyi]
MSPDSQLVAARPGTTAPAAPAVWEPSRVQGSPPLADAPEPDPALDLRGALDPHGDTDAAADPHAAWSRVLDDLAAMAAGAGPDAGGEVMGRLVLWTPPTDLGRLPASLVDRALEVLAGHAHVVDHLHDAVAENRRHARALSAVPTVHDAPVAAYLDVEA